MSAKINWIVTIFAGATALITTLFGTVFGLQNSKINKVEDKVDLEVEDRKEENQKQWDEIKEIRQDVTETKVTVNLIADNMGIKRSR